MQHHETLEKNRSNQAFNRSDARFRFGRRLSVGHWIPGFGHRPFGFLSHAAKTQPTCSIVPSGTRRY